MSFVVNRKHNPTSERSAACAVAGSIGATRIRHTQYEGSVVDWVVVDPIEIRGSVIEIRGISPKYVGSGIGFIDVRKARRIATLNAPRRLVAWDMACAHSVYAVELFDETTIDTLIAAETATPRWIRDARPGVWAHEDEVLAFSLWRLLRIMRNVGLGVEVIE